MAFSIDSFDISFKNVSYWIDIPGGKAKTILRSVSGLCQSGRLLALMGRSGAGKTTLLDVLSCQATGGMMSGDILVNGQPRNCASFKKISCYVMQKDVLLGSATVREALTTSAQLRLPRNISASAVKARVDALIHELGLQKCADTMIGDETMGIKGISGGEKRRVSIGLELVTRPRVVFLDEPTSGLDSDTAFTIVKLLQRLARHDRTVVCTIHQPSSDIMECVSDLMLLAGGQCCYCGPYSQAVPFFAETGFRCPMYKNPADFFMALMGKQVAVDMLLKATNRKVAAGQIPPPNGWPALAQSSSRDDDDDDTLPQLDINVAAEALGGKHGKDLLMSLPPSAPISRTLTSLSADILDTDSGKASHRANVFYQTWVLSVRFFRSWLRNSMLLASELFQYVFFGLTLGLMYLQLSSSLDKAPFNRSSAIWFSLVVMCFTPSTTAIITWEAERILLRRETTTGAYSLFAYYAAKTLVVTPFEMVLTTVYTTIMYFMVGLQPTVSKFFVHLVVMILFQLASETVGMLCAVATKAAAYAVVLQSLALIYLLSFSGFLLNSVPVYFRWIPKISYLNYAYVALMKNEVYGLELKDSNGAIVEGRSVLPAQIDNGWSVLGNITILAGLTVGMRVLCYILLRVAAKLKYL